MSAKIELEQFTNKELVNAICNWLIEDIDQSVPNNVIADVLKSGAWLSYYNDKLTDELPHHNS